MKQNNTPQFYTSEKHRSQIPALQVLSAMGYEYIPAEMAIQYRHNRFANVIMEEILLKNLQRINSYEVKGQKYQFSDGALHNAIIKLKESQTGGFIADAEEKYNLLRLGTTESQITDGDKKDKSIKYIDWDNIKNNKFHMVAEYSVERTKSNKTYRPDIVLFVNGIPFAVIECKAPATGSDEGISQHIRNQKPDGIRSLYEFSQILISTDGNDVRYATTGTPPRQWARWKELNNNDDYINNLLNINLMGNEFSDLAMFKPEKIVGRSIIEQDRAIFGLLSPQRLLKVSKDNIVFDNNVKKVARYQQHFAIDKIMERINEFNGDRRKGGVIWHTQGSGKSLTMVMTAMKIASTPEIKNPRIIIVTDRIDLDEQIHKTFQHCGYDKDTIHRSVSGTDLLKTIKDKKHTVITTLIHKFQSVVEKVKFVDEDSNVFIMVDEAHRSQFGELYTYMERTFPNASLLGFTGTPISKKDKNTYVKFGEIIDKYTIDQAIQDKAIVELLYEPRMVEQEINDNVIDKWFERLTFNLSEEQKKDLKKKYSRSEILTDNKNTLKMIAWDISEHFYQHMKTNGFKGQVVAPNRAAAVKMKNYFDKIGRINTEVVITLGDSRVNDEDDVYEGSTDIINDFSQKMIDKYGDEKKYNTAVIDEFKDGKNIDVVIVVSKLLTGFDVPANSVIYLCKKLAGHNLLQAIARVNRLYEEKEHGLIIDYQGVLEDLTKSLNEYTSLQDFDEADLHNAVMNVKTEIAHLPSHYNNLMNIFKGVKNTSDTEEYIDILRDQETRDDFYTAISKFSKTLDLAVSTTSFYNDTDKNTINNYKQAEKKFKNLRAEAKIRFAEAVDWKKYEKEVKELVDDNLLANDVVVLSEPINIMDEVGINEFLGKDISKASKADTIASQAQRTITEKMEEDPAFYKKFSKMLQDLIDAFRQKRIDESQYYEGVVDVATKVREKRHDDLPNGIKDNTFEAKVFGNVKDKLTVLEEEKMVQVVIEMSDIALEYLKLVDFEKNMDAQNNLKNKLDDYVYMEIEKKQNIKMNGDDLHGVIETIVSLTKKNRD